METIFHGTKVFYDLYMYGKLLLHQENKTLNKSNTIIRRLIIK